MVAVVRIVFLSAAIILTASAMAAQKDAAGTWTDAKTNLIWVTQDYQEPVYWQEADAYCHDLRTGGYGDWRLPSINQLATLYDSSAKHLRAPITVRDPWLWTANKEGTTEAWLFSLSNGQRTKTRISDDAIVRAHVLCLRQSK